jgi:putative transposase
VTRFIEERHGRFGVELICRVLDASQSTYHAARNRLPSARAITDAWLTEEIQRVFEVNYGVYGARKVWRQLHRDRDRMRPSLASHA